MQRCTYLFLPPVVDCKRTYKVEDRHIVVADAVADRSMQHCTHLIHPPLVDCKRVYKVEDGHVLVSVVRLGERAVVTAQKLGLEQQMRGTSNQHARGTSNKSDAARAGLGTADDLGISIRCVLMGGRSQVWVNMGRRHSL